MIGYPTALLAVVFASSVSEPVAPERPWPVGELLVYRVKFTGISAGTATMAVYPPELIDDRRAVRINMRTVSHGLASRIVRVDDSMTSWIDALSGGMIRYRLDKSEGDRRELEELNVEPSSATVRSYLRKTSGKEKHYTLAMVGSAPPQDTLSLFYYLRRIPLKVDAPVELTVYQRRKAFPLRLKPVGIDRIRVTRVGTFSAFRIRPEAAAPGLFSDTGEVIFWVEKTTHVLLRMVVDLRFGSSSMCLIKVRNSPLLRAPGGPDAKGKKPDARQ